MVLTRQQARAREPAEEKPPSAGNGDEYEERVPESGKTRGKKHAKATTRGKEQRKRSETTKFPSLLDMPIDVLCEIFAFVHPKDLIWISWTSKALNRFLSSRSLRCVWQAAFETIPEAKRPPPCSLGITEMAYAKLLYGELCMICAKTGPLVQAWIVFVKTCERCVKEIIINLAYSRLSGAIPDSLTHNVLPLFKGWYSQGVLLSGSRQFDQEIVATGGDFRKKIVFEIWSSIPCESLKVIDYPAPHHWKPRYCERYNFSDAITQLESLAEAAMENVRADILKRRTDGILEKLSEEGWREEIIARKSEYEKGLLGIKGVQKLCLSCEKEWGELRGSLHKFMREKFEELRTRFRIDKIRRIVDSFYESLPHPHDFHPSVADICWIPEVQKTIINGTDEEFEACEADTRARLPKLSATLLEERRNFFLTLLPQDSPTVKHLSLATTMFDCEKCVGRGMRIEKTLSHTCKSHGWDCPGEMRFKNLPSKHIAKVFYDEARLPWDSGYSEYRYSEGLSNLAREIVLECGEDPDTITTKEMNKKHLRFVCFRENGAITVLSWDRVLYSRFNRTASPCRFLQPCELPEYQPDPMKYGPHRRDWGCLRCWGIDSNWRHVRFRDLKGHLGISHGIENPTEEDYYHEDPDHTAPSIEYKATNSTRLYVSGVETTSSLLC